MREVFDDWSLRRASFGKSKAIVATFVTRQTMRPGDVTLVPSQLRRNHDDRSTIHGRKKYRPTMTKVNLCVDLHFWPWPLLPALAL
jgi:hypothetical protein